MSEPSRDAEYEAQKAWHEAYEKAELAKGLCPWSGERLTARGEAGPDRLSCWMCDCFGYLPEEVRRHE